MACRPWPVFFNTQTREVSMLSSFTRRLFLSGAAALPATAVAAAAPALLTVTPAEDVRLLALGERIDPLLEAYRAAIARKAIARALAEGLCPPVPDELVCKRGPYDWAEVEQDVEGKEIHPTNYISEDGKTYGRMPRYILKAEELQGAIDCGNLYAPKRTKFGKKIHAQIKTAKEYEANREAAIERSGILQAASELRHAAYDIEHLAYRVREIEPLTMVGVTIVGRTLDAYGEAEHDLDHYKGRCGQLLGRHLAAAVLRLARA
jgi:hypothetical protein